ncbi:MAG: penicillin-binding protein, partial [Micromonosporaceae bacterium]|nr:penicillin-binding protein [Micromonosporaceae bacterium]
TLSLLGADGQQLTGEAAGSHLTGLLGDLATMTPKVTVKKKPEEQDQDATAKITVSWQLATEVAWTYDAPVRLHRSGDTWKVVFAPSVVHPSLADGANLALKRTAAERGPILDGEGQAIVTQRPVVLVGLQPNAIPETTSVVTQLTLAINKVEPSVTFDDLPAKLAAAKADAFVEVITLRREKYLQIKPELQAIAGTRFRESTMPLAPTSTFAKALLGSTGEVTKEIMDKNPGTYQVGDRVGLSGLQKGYDAVLRGTPAMQITAVGSDGAASQPLFTSEAKAGAAVRTTLDSATQNAAESALAAESLRSALVALRISDGALIAVANGPGGGQLNLALTAQVPPGSTFKMVTALGVLGNGSVTADSVVPCPKELVVDGRTFTNSHAMALGDVPLHVDFAKSCNTAFASLAPKLGADGLATTAATLGVGTSWDLGTDTFSGKVSSGGSDAERAAAAFGQGATVVSPVALAGAVAAVARGQWKQPRLVTEPAPAAIAPDGQPLPEPAVTALRSMMREVITAGTADQLNRYGEVYGKTGTAEYDDADASKTHSWFIGYRGDIAFAVLVENGGLGSEAAVPVAGRFLAGLKKP